MGIVDIPDSYEAFESWALAYERAQFRFAETNRKIGAATRDLFASWFPRLLAPFVRCGIYAMLDDAMIDSFGVPRPVPGRRALLRSGLELRGLVVRWLHCAESVVFSRTIGIAPTLGATESPTSAPHDSLRRKRADTRRVTPRIATLHRTLVGAGLH